MTQEEKLIRKELGLPVRKQLIYYTNTWDENSAVNVKSIQLLEMFTVTRRWYTVELTLSDDTKVRIHSRYLREMQKPHFISDMSQKYKKHFTRKEERLYGI